MKTHFSARHYTHRVTGQLESFVTASNLKLSSPGEVWHATCQSVVRMVNPERDNCRNTSAHTQPNANHLAFDGPMETFRQVGSFGWQQPVMTAPTSVALSIIAIVRRGEAHLRCVGAEWLQAIRDELTKVRISFMRSILFSLIYHGRFAGMTVRTALLL